MPTIYRLLFGLLSVGLAVAGQNRLEADLLFDALFFYSAGILLLVDAFFRVKLPELSLHQVPIADEIEPTSWSHRWWWQLAVTLIYSVGLGAGIWALYLFNQDFERPASSAWPLYILSISLTLLSAALLDNASFTLAKFVQRHQAEHELDLGHVPIAPLRLGLRMVIFLKAFLSGLGYLFGFWQGNRAPDKSHTANEDISASPTITPEMPAIDEPTLNRRAPWLPRHGWLFLGILLLALFLRVYRYAEWPPGIWYDEAAAGMFGVRYLEDPAWRPVFPGSINVTGHYIYLVAKSIEIFGPTAQAVRWVSLFFGMLTIPAAYLAGRELFGRSVGLIFMFLMAVSRWHINFSRIGMYNIATPLFVLLSLAYLLMALRRNRHMDFALAGISLGLGLCFYPAFQLFVAATGFYLLYQILVVRGFLARYWYGLAVMTTMLLLVVSPLALFAYKKSDVYFARTQETSLFTNKAPEERLPALLKNTQKHLLMFNLKGDPNGRHNLPGEPMLDPLTGALMVLGLAFCLLRFWRPRSLFLPLCLALALLGGILSLDFEAPQSLRSIVSLPIVYLLAAIPIYLIWQAWVESVSRYFPRTFGFLIPLLLFPIGWSNVQTYFVRQMSTFASWNAFSTPETIAAETLLGLDEQTDAYVISYFQGHPAIGYLARGIKPFRRLETTDHLPLPWPDDKNVLLLLNAESRSLFDEARRFYPNATFEEVKPPFGGPTVVYKALLSQSDIRSIQGLTGFYYANENWSGSPVLTQKDPQLAFDWSVNLPAEFAVDAPFSVEWRGVLRVENFGQHQLILQAPAQADLFINEELILSANASQEATGLVMAEGNHSVRLRSVGAPGLFTLAWRPPDRTYEVIPPQVLFVPPVTSNGLLGNYYPNGNWEGPPSLARIDAHFNLYFHVTPLKRPYTVEWLGKIGIPLAGSYTFGLESIDESILMIDGQEVVAAVNRNQLEEGTIELESGLHDIRLRFADRTDHTHVNFYWIPPGGERQIVPAEVLFPPQGSYERVSIPSMGQLLFDPNNPGQIDLLTPTLFGAIEPIARNLVNPSGVAVMADGTIFVADPGQQKVLGYGEDGRLQTEITGIYTGDDLQPFLEPFDLATDSQGRLLVIDAGTGILSVFDSQGVFEATIPIRADFLFRARGLDVDATDRIWVPLTAAGRVAAFDMDGELLLDFPVWPDEPAQPVDLLALPNGDILVTDAGIYKLIRYDSEGRRLLAWDIPVANTFQGPHLTLDETGFIYMTDPEAGRIAKLDSNGERIGEWILSSVIESPSQPVGIAVDATGRIWYTDNAQGVLGRVIPAQ